MGQTVTVYDASGVVAGTTFNRRAKQLVLKGRADWTDETHTAVRLIPERTKEALAVDEYTKKSAEGTADDAQRRHDAGPAYGAITEVSERDCLRCLARKRVAEKRKAVTHVVAYGIGLFFLVLVDSLSMVRYSSYNSGLLTGIYLSWGAFTVWHVAKFLYERMRGFSRYREDPVEAEYKRLKMMDGDRVVTEFRKL